MIIPNRWVYQDAGKLANKMAMNLQFIQFPCGVENTATNYAFLWIDKKRRIVLSDYMTSDPNLND